MPRLTHALRDFVLLVVALGVAVCMLSTVQAVESQLVEVLYVQGCEMDSKPPRTTGGCFGAEGQNATNITVKLTIRGLNFPEELMDGSAPVYRVWLEETVPPPVLPVSEDELTATSVQPYGVECTSVKPSAIFPTQLLTCELPHPFSQRDAIPEEALLRLEKGPMWMDVFVQVVVSDPDDPESQPQPEPIGLLRRAVQLDVSNATHQQDLNGSSKSGSGKRSKFNETMKHPLERLYANPSRDPNSTLETDGWMELGIGGLKKELRTLFRRVFLSRLPSLEPLTTALEIQHVRGVILYGPPGNGKTLIARSLYRLLGPDTRLTVVNAADVLSKYVGESEKNLRDVFEGYSAGTSTEEETARQDGKKVPKREAVNSTGLHVLVIDEFEALFRRRGHSADESSAKAVYDGVTNTLLSLMDGIHSRNDLLVIGLTNRLQSIDAALLRPGRFEVLIEVPSPDVPSREEIFFIHTERLREANFLAKDVDLYQLAMRTGGFSGSDIAGTVRSAISYALLRFREGAAFLNATANATSAAACDAATPSPASTGAGSDVEWNATATVGSVDPEAAVANGTGFEVTLLDFDRAMKDIRSAKDEAASLTHLTGEDSGTGQRELVDHDGTVVESLDTARDVIDRVLHSHRHFSALIGISGATGNGKTELAQRMAELHPFTTIRYLSCRRLIELRDRDEQIAKIRDALSEASRTESGFVVLDDYDVLVDSVMGNIYIESTLRSLLYEFLYRRQGVSRSLAGPMDSAFAAEDTGGETVDGNVVVSSGSVVSSETNRRILVVTSGRGDMLRQLQYDAVIRVQPVNRGGVQKLLSHYRVLSPSAKDNLRKQVARSYPVTLSYRNFLRVTDMALWKLQTERERQQRYGSGSGDAQGGVEGSGPELPAIEMPAFFATSPSESAERPQLEAKQAANDFYALTTYGTAREFASAVREVVRSMGLADPFRAWYRSGPMGEVAMATGAPAMADVDDAMEEDAEMDDEAVDGAEVAW